MAFKKQYGLVISHNKKSKMIKKPSVFGDDNSSDEDEQVSAKREFSASIRKEGIKKMQSKANREAIAEALAEDPTIYEYDAIYDQLQEQKKLLNPKLQEKKDTKSRYIANLKRTSELRKIEQELAYERRVQKERDAEGGEFSDKEQFVTGAYKQKLLERTEMEKRLKVEEEKEKLNDVTKENDLGRMYKHLLNQKTSLHTSTPDSNKEMNRMSNDVNESELAIQDPPIESADKDPPIESADKDPILIESADKDPILTGQDSILTDIQQPLPDHSLAVDNDNIVHQSSQHNDEEIKESKEERRRRLFAKRTSNNAAMSAKERYLARKRAKHSQPTVINDDD